MKPDLFWILDLAALFLPSIRQICDRPPVVAARFNYVPRPITADRILELVEAALADGLIFLDEFEIRSVGCIPLVSQRITSKSNFIRSWGDETKDWFYGLTMKGGSAWEEAAQPDWQQFFRDEYDELEGHEYVTLSASSITTLQRAVRFLERLRSRRIGAFSREQARNVAPWDATYWKRLPEGLEVCLPVMEIDGRLQEHVAVDEVRAFRQFCGFGFSRARARRIVEE
jgi:hypothetical protein